MVKLETQESPWYISGASPKAHDPRRAYVSVRVWAGKDQSLSSNSRAGRVPYYSREGWSFCSFQTFNWLDEGPPHWREQSTLLSLLIQMLISSKNTLTDMPRIMFDQISGYPVTQSSWHKIYHYTWCFFTVSSPVLGTGETGWLRYGLCPLCTVYAQPHH